MTERTLEDIQRDFATGARVQCTVTGRDGIILMRDNFGATVLWDGMDQPLHHQANQLKGLPPRVSVIETGRQRTAAIDTASAVSSSSANSGRRVDPFDTGSMDSM